jgi:hypothetical protein
MMLQADYPTVTNIMLGFDTFQVIDLGKCKNSGYHYENA